MINPTFECAMCKRDLLNSKVNKFVIIDGKVEQICSYCNNKYTPDEIKSVKVIVNFKDKQLIKEYNLGLFLNNSFTENDITNYSKSENPKLTKYLKKILGINEEVLFCLEINILKRRLNRCEICNKFLDFEDCIYFKTGTKNNFIQVCKECDKQY